MQSFPRQQSHGNMLLSQWDPMCVCVFSAQDLEMNPCNNIAINSRIKRILQALAQTMHLDYENLCIHAWPCQEQTLFILVFQSPTLSNIHKSEKNNTSAFPRSYGICVIFVLKRFDNIFEGIKRIKPQSFCWLTSHSSSIFT